jgi:asparagine synthase (glutamine-hydrolysing)
LRRELEQQGCTFRSSGDSEVLLQAYATWGPDCLARFNGMWAFLIYDRDRGTIFGARDRFGVKPLYRHLTARGVCLASEIKAIRAAGGHHGGICWPVASRFLLQGRLEEDERTFYEDIEQVPPGHAFEVTLDGAWKQWAYWSLASVPFREVREPVDEFRGLFEDAVRLRMRSDVPVGVCLSGGLTHDHLLDGARPIHAAGAGRETTARLLLHGPRIRRIALHRRHACADRRAAAAPAGGSTEPVGPAAGVPAPPG